MYVEYLENRLREARETQDNKQLAYLRKFQANLNEGINYYRQFFEKYEHKLQEMKRDVFSELEAFTQKLEKNKI